MLFGNELAIPTYLMVHKQKKEKTVDTIVVGLDTETYEGEPITVQLHSDDHPRMTRVLWTDASTVTDQFFKHITRACKKDSYYRMYVHHLPFDAVSLFYPRWRELIRSEVEWAIGEWKVSVIYGRPTFIKIYSRQRRIRIDIVDSLLWFATSLDRAAEEYCPDLPKLPRLKGLGTKRFTRKDKLFVQYAERDAQVSARLGRIIETMHESLGIAPTISLAQMAANVFRSHYIDDPIQQPPREYMQAGLDAYHGGKNYVGPGSAPAWHVDVNAYDLSSAYPYAMTQLPSFTRTENYKEKCWQSPNVRAVPVPGIYCISGRVKKGARPIIYDHGFFPIEGKFEHVWVTGYELNEAINKKSVVLSGRIKGCYYEHDGRVSPLQRFADEFYRAKQTATDPVERFRNKIILNSLSGKFIQTREVEDTEDGSMKKVRVAGGLYHPFIAASITGHTRAVMHHIEHELEAFHTATDGVFTTRNLRSDLGLPSEGIGSLQNEGTGTLALARNKLYIFYDDDRKGFPSPSFEGKFVQKYARHGYQGTLKQLEEMICTGRRQYSVNRPNSIKESFKRDLTPNKFERHDMILKVGPFTIYS